MNIAFKLLYGYSDYTSNDQKPVTFTCFTEIF